MYKYVLIFLLLVAAASCRKPKATECNDEIALSRLSDFRVGVAISYPDLLTNPIYNAIALKQFNSFTPENIFKPGYLHPALNEFNWADADTLVAICTKNNARIHGHTLIWHQQLPDWINDFQGTAEEWDQLMKTHIQTVMQHFKGKVAGWDVVNEAFNEDGTLRNSIWRQKIGTSYLEKAFRYAHEADPNALLFYNDYNLESNVIKRNVVINYLNDLRNRGVKVDGIGLQMHISLGNPDESQIAGALQQVVANQYQLHLSEIDISVNLLNNNPNPDAATFDRQANLLAKIAGLYKAIPVQYKYGITFWGVSDGNSWIRPYYNRQDYPLLYDDNYHPKPAYCKLKEVL